MAMRVKGAQADTARNVESGSRWVSVGSSAAVDSRSAGTAAAAGAVLRDDVQLLIVFCSVLHDPVAVLAGIRSVAPGVPLIGCSTPAVITSTGATQGRGVVVAALGGADFSVATRAGTGAVDRPSGVGAEVAGCVIDLADRPHQVLLLLTEGLAFGQEEILAGAYSVLGASVPLVGGVAGAAPGAPTTFHFHGDEVLTDAVVGAGIGSSGPLGVAVRHGWRRVGEPMIVTWSADGYVRTLNDQPALAAYLDRLGAPREAYTDPTAFDAFAQTRPIGIRRRSGEEVRNVSSTTGLSKGWLRSGGEVPEGSLIWPMEGDVDSVIAAGGDACRDAVHALGDHKPLGLLAFDCDARRRLLAGEGIQREVAQMTEHAGGAPLAGLYTWGEIVRTRGINGFHNQTLVVLAVA
jgi:hypothetical protein